MNPDVVVAGAGIIGCAVARRLAKEGRKVLILDRGEVARESSWAACGILTPVHLAEYPKPLEELCVASAKLYPSLVDEARKETAIDPEYRVSGMLMLSRNDEDRRTIATVAAWKRERGQPSETVARPREIEPLLSDSLEGGLLLPDIAQVRNHRLTRALAEAAVRYGAEIRTGCEVTGFLRVPGRITGVKTAKGDILARETVMAAGAWSADLLGPVGLSADVHPVRGQMVLLEGRPGLLRHIILWGDRYLVPRADGMILAGSTLEDVGFDKRNTVEGVAGILGEALGVAPGLNRLTVAATWAGLRPMTPDRLPYLGRPPGLEGLVLATGHGRNGILLAPITARIVSDLLAGRPGPVDIAPFRVDR